MDDMDMNRLAEMVKVVVKAVDVFARIGRSHPDTFDYRPLVRCGAATHRALVRLEASDRCDELRSVDSGTGWRFGEADLYVDGSLGPGTVDVDLPSPTAGRGPATLRVRLFDGLSGVAR